MTDQPSIFDDLAAGLVAQARALAEQIAGLPLDKQVAVLNAVRQELHAVSPFRDEPVDCVLWLPAERVHANDYNPNRVAPPEMRLLEISVASDGYTQPVVASPDGSEDVEVIDGFHRARVGKESPKVRRRVHGYLPCSLIRPSRAGRNNRIAATIRHNRARGVHGVLPMTDIVAELLRNGWTDDEVARELGMDADEVLRFKQNTGLPELFATSAYSRAWE
jgi:ParB-like chromosome segregation protein Spo0J